MSRSSESTRISRIDAGIRAVLMGCHYGGIAFIVAMMLLTVAHTIGRYVFQMPIKGATELSSYFLIASAFLVGAYTLMIKGHVSIGILVERFPERTRAIIDSFTYLLCLVFATWAAWQSSVRGIYMMQVQQGSAVLNIPNFPFVYLVAVGWGMLGLASIMHLALSLRMVKN